MNQVWSFDVKIKLDQRSELSKQRFPKQVNEMTVLFSSLEIHYIQDNDEQLPSTDCMYINHSASQHA